MDGKDDGKWRLETATILVFYSCLDREIVFASGKSQGIFENHVYNSRKKSVLSLNIYTHCETLLRSRGEEGGREEGCKSSL